MKHINVAVFILGCLANHHLVGMWNSWFQAEQRLNTQEFEKMIHRDDTVDFSTLADTDPFIFTTLFEACKKNHLGIATQILEAKPHLDLNTTHNGKTPLLIASQTGHFNIVQLLLDYKADKNIRDNDNHSVFSNLYSFYITDVVNKKHLYNGKTYAEKIKEIFQNYYTAEEIAIECKNATYSYTANAEYRVEIMLQLKDSQSVNYRYYSFDKASIILAACRSKDINEIIKLLQKGASLDIQDNFTKPYDVLTKNANNSKSPFPIREALNEKNNVPIEIIHIFQKTTCCPNNFTDALISDVRQIIKHFYHILAINLKGPEAQIWKPVCVRACELADIQETDEDECLTHILLWPSKKRTAISLQLAWEDK